MATTQQNSTSNHVTQNADEKAQREPPNDTKDSPNGLEKKDQNGQGPQKTSSGQEQKKGPAGGYDNKPVPRPPPGTIGYTIKITFHRATNLAIGDVHVLSSDPYVLAQLNTGLPQRHKEDPNLRFRTPTVRKSTEPEWNEEWIVANVPSSGFKLKIRVYDEDSADHDDILGKVHFSVPHLSDDWAGINNQPHQLRVRDSSKRALSIRAVARCFQFVEHLRGEIYLSIELLRRTEEDGECGRAYTVGPCRWIRHYSPLLGRIANTKEPSDSSQGQDAVSCPVEKRIRTYNFQANEMQLPGPVPAKLYHRFVEFRPWVKRMFTTSGFQGVVLGKALHHQHTRVYNFDRSTLFGYHPEGPSVEMTQQFLDLVHYDQGGRIFTYVLTLDALWRFTETGKEFGIDMLSKHTMHSDVSIYIAFSGEFFVRRLKHRHRPQPPHPIEGSSQQDPPDHLSNEMIETADEEPSKDPSHYQLVIDNDSGTYRPNADMLPLLASFLSQSLPGLHIQTLDCQADAEKMTQMKSEQRERKQREGDNIIYAQDDNSSISSSEDERLDEIQAALDDEGEQDQARQHVSVGDGAGKEEGHFEQVAKQILLNQKEKASKVQKTVPVMGKEENSSASQQ